VYNWLHSNSQFTDLCFLKLNIGNYIVWTMFSVKKMSRYIYEYVFADFLSSDGDRVVEYFAIDLS
jgi:hypothetical protein